MSVADSNLQPHASVLSVVKCMIGSKTDTYVIKELIDLLTACSTMGCAERFEIATHININVVPKEQQYVL